MRRRSTNGRLGNGVMTRSKRQQMEREGFADSEKDMKDDEMDSYIQTLDEKIDLIHEKEDVTWEDYESSSEDEAPSDDESYDDKNERKISYPGLLHHLFWTSIGVCLVIPVVIYRWKYSTYPMNNPSLLRYIFRVIINLVTLCLLTCFAYAGVCSTDTFLVGFFFKFPTNIDQCGVELWSVLFDCANNHGIDAYMHHECKNPLGRLIGSFLLLLAFLWFYSRRVQVILALFFLAHHGLQWQQHLLQSNPQSEHIVEITSMDPTFAYANESIQIVVDGFNLYEGLSVSWVEYWGCSRTQSISTCPKLYEAQLHGGIVPVSFPKIDEYTICTKANANSAYLCFESMRLKVKDKKSNPGWSLSQL